MRIPTFPPPAILTREKTCPPPPRADRQDTRRLEPVPAVMLALALRLAARANIGCVLGAPTLAQRPLEMRGDARTFWLAIGR